MTSDRLRAAAIFLALAMLFVTTSLSAVRHGPADMLAAAAPAAGEKSAQHSHSHDDTREADQRAGHAPSHNPADHSHDPPLAPREPSIGDQPTGIGWSSAEHGALPGRMAGRLDRPPDLMS